MHCGATGLLPNASRAGVALRASVAVRPPQRWNGLPEDAHACATNHKSNASRVKYVHRCATGPLSNASRAEVALRASVAMRPPQRSNGLPEDAHRCATSHWSNASRVQDRRCSPARLVLCRTRRARVALRASVANTSLSLRNHHAGLGGGLHEKRLLSPTCRGAITDE